MEQEKDMRLVNIYIKIHNKKTLTLDDLSYLAKVNPECFRKTCDNLIYNIPKAKPLVEEKELEPKNTKTEEKPSSGNIFEISPEEKARTEKIVREFLSNLQKMESEEISDLQDVDVEQVKDLVGNLYMEMMFPHSGVPGYFQMYDGEQQSTFNVKA